VRTLLIVSGCAISAFAVLILASAILLAAEQRGPDGAPNPTASVLSEQVLLQQAPQVKGFIVLPDTKAAVLIQPAGREWDYFRTTILPWGGTLAIGGMIIALAVAYAVLGRTRLLQGRSGRKVQRFTAFERFSHWLTAVSFVVLALTGLNITFGKLVLLPAVGADAFAGISQAAKYAHNFVSFSFVIGLVLIGSNWINDNIPRKVDLDWFKQGGGFVKSRHAPAGRFNGGEKLIYWFALAGGAAVAISGYLLLFPFYLGGIASMQVAHVVHAIVAILFIAMILAHIYIGTLGTEGAFEAMATGKVDINWGRQHHNLWLADLLSKSRQAAEIGKSER
jgi:formate dehydrogenase subunit gamma